jgi:hypothetical protein
VVKIEEAPTLWYTTHSMDRYQAQAQAWEGKVNIALKLLEFENALGLAGKTAEEIGDGPEAERARGGPQDCARDSG